MDQIGRITVPTPTASGLTFPLTTDFGYGVTRPMPTITHRFGEYETKAQQIFQVGIGPRKFQFRRQILSRADRTRLVNFFEAVEGSFQSFTYNAPSAEQSTTNYNVIFELQPLSIEELVHGCRVGLTFIECPDPSSAPSYPVNSTCSRFPSSALQTALLAQVQQIIPLVHIRVREQAVPDIYLSDRRVTVGGQLYLPRLLNIGEPGSDVIMTQDISGRADSVRFTFGNPDRVMTQLSNDTDLKYAEIDLCLYHVNTGILLQLWKGFIQNFVSDGTAQFPVQCSDGMFQIMQQYPVRTASRTCWKPFKDGVNCPYVGSSASCDYTYDGPNGCVAHGMSQYFGGIQASQQAALAHSGGDRVTATSIVSDSMWGKALPEIWCNQGSVGHVGAMNPDDLYAFWTTAIMAIVRDEAQWLDAIGIVGVGPIGAYTIIPGYAAEVQHNADGMPVFIGPTVDGFAAQGAQGWKGGDHPIPNKTPSGLRQIVGSDPAGADETFGLTGTGGAEPGSSFAAGVAFVELRYQKSGGVTPTTPEQHTMLVPIAQGLTGWTWDANGNRSAVQGLTNPFWIAVNTYLRAIGMFNADSATQLQYFDMASLVNNNSWTDANGNTYPGNGCAQIADLVVPDILGAGSEKQFQFQGSLADQKPVRDWLTEILNCGLGYFTFQFGKLSLGCRINASAVDTFTRGNILYQSLKLAPIQAAFERLILSYADRDYQFQSNTAEYQDKDHAIYYGRLGAPLTARMNSVGCPTLNQALRLAMTRVREEIGGVNRNNGYNNGTNIDPTDWLCARMATWETTLLALNTTVGQVVSMTHPDIPGPRGTCTVASGVCSSLTGALLDRFILNKYVMIGAYQCEVTAVTTDSNSIVTSFTVSPAPADGANVAYQFVTSDFRIQSWKLKKDWSIEIIAKSVTASMYATDLGPQPADVGALPLPVMPYPEPLGTWAPYQIQAPATDALFPGEWTFDLTQIYTPGADGSKQASITAAGKMPVNSFIAFAGAPGITAGSISQQSTGGAIPGGSVLRIVVCGADASGHLTPPSQVIIAQIAEGTNTNQFTLSGIVWPAVAGLAGYVLFASTDDSLICFAQSGSLTASGGSYTPTSITCLGPLPRSSWALPNANIAKVRLKGKLLVHGGPVGARVDAVNGSTITAYETIDTRGTDSWSGRALAIMGRYQGAAPYQSFFIQAFDATTGVFTLQDNKGAPADLSAVQVGDAFVVCFKGYDNSAAPTMLTDDGLTDAESGHGGLIPGAEKGLIIRVIAGTNRGAMAKVVDNTNVSYALDQPLVIGPDSVWVVEDSAWTYSVDATDSGNADYQLATSLMLPTTNFLDFSMLVGAFTVDANGVESDEAAAPVRMIYIYGDGYIQAFITDSIYNMSVTDHVLTFHGSNQVLNLAPLNAIRRFPRYIIHDGAGVLTVNAYPGDTIEGLTQVTLQPGDRMQIMPSS